MDVEKVLELLLDLEILVNEIETSETTDVSGFASGLYVVRCNEQSLKFVKK